MNKSDLKLIIIVLILIILLIIIINSTKEKGSVAEVYYEDKIVLKIDLNKDGFYTVDGALGEVLLEVDEGKIRVKSENSPRNICSKEGFIDNTSKALICLPNKIVVKIVGESEIDGVVY